MKVSRRIALGIASALVVIGAAFLLISPFPSRDSATAVRLGFMAPDDNFHGREANLNSKQMDEFFGLLDSSRRLWLQKKMIALGTARIETDSGKTKVVSLLTIPGQYDAFQIEGSQFTVQPAGQIEKFLASLPPDMVRMTP